MSIELSIVMPCLNEARTLPACLKKAHGFLAQHGVLGEIIVADNGSSDGSREIALRHGARVVASSPRGYGVALQAGIAAATGRFVVMGDADDSYDFAALLPILAKLRDGCDLVVGNRFLGGIEPGAMPFLHRYLGNPGLSAIGRLFFKCDEVGDFYCGLRGFRREAIEALELRCSGMEFALEMIIKATMHGQRISEVPVTLNRDGRDRPPHLRSYVDGWRSLRLFLLMSPRWFFGYPGIVLLAGGLVCTAVLLVSPMQFRSVYLGHHPLLYGAAAMVLGYQSILLAIIAKLTAVGTGLHPPLTRLRALMRPVTLERMVIGGAVLALCGIGLGVVGTLEWVEAGLERPLPARAVRYVVGSVLLLLLGGQTAQAGFFLGVIGLFSRWKSGESVPEVEAVPSSRA